MKAVVYHGPGDLKVEDLPIPKPGRGEILIHLRASGVCGSDLGAYRHKTPRRKPPLVLGHECAGEVAEVGPGVSGLRGGVPVIAHPVWGCANCSFCSKGLVQFCPQACVLGIGRPGSFAEYFLAHQSMVVPMPQGMPYRLAAFTEPLACTARASKTADVGNAEHILIIGAGTMGLFLLAWIRSRTQARISVISTNESKLAVAAELGADQIILDSESNEKQVSAMGQFDLIFEAVGVEQTIRQAIQSAATHSKVIIIGTLAASPGLPLMKTVSGEITIRGSYISSMDDFRDALGELSTGQSLIERLNTRVVTLEKTPALFDSLTACQDGYQKGIVISE